MAEHRSDNNDDKTDRGRTAGGRFTPGSKEASELGRAGGHASSGSFEKGSERAREAGRKGGVASHRR